MSMKDKYAFVGVGVTKQGKIPEMDVNDLATQAIQLALEDAGMRRDEVDGLFFQPGIGAGLGGAAVLRRVGIPAKFALPAQMGGDGCIVMVAMACGALEAGLCQACILLHASSASTQRILVGAGGEQRSTEGAYGLYGPVGGWAFIARRHMHLYGLTREHLGSVALTLRENANRRPEAVMYEKKLTMDDYMNARMIVEPLCLYDCCLVNDGAVALIITSAERAKDYKKPPVYVMGYGMDNSLRVMKRSPQALMHFDGLVAQKAGENAFRMAEVTLKDVDVAQLYDAFTPFIISQLESYGICGRGEAGPFVKEGNIKLDGAFPCNTSGTEHSWSYMQGFTHMTEGIRQMRGESGECQIKDAEICMVTGGSGSATIGGFCDCCILRR
jgi:acetyl-CoA acetyltransferase